METAYMNKTIFQFFHWYILPEDNLWNSASAEAKNLASMGITHIWLPPAYKSAKGVAEPGYAVYDLYDLGEFNQKGTVRTKYGTKQEYLQAIEALHKVGIQVLADIVLNHKMGGDEMEEVHVKTANPANRNEFIGDVHTIEAPTKFTFPGRNGKYSNYIWDKYSFTGFRENEDIKLILHEHSKGQWDEMTDDENGNYDYLMGKDVEFRNVHVREELKKWGRWLISETGIDGFRLDALKHINSNFYPEWIDHIKQVSLKDFMVIGEYWESDVAVILKFIQATQEKIQMFDVPLHYNLQRASIEKSEYDLRNTFNDTVVKEKPNLAITFVDNHDTQPLQALESTVEAWFKPLAYALILLREGGTPCAFYPAVYGASYQGEKQGKTVAITIDKVALLPTLLRVRIRLAYGLQRDYFDEANLIGWTREGNKDMQYSGLAVLVSNARSSEKRMTLGSANAGMKLRDVTGNQTETVLLNDEGEGIFKVGAETISVWIDERQMFA